METHLEKQRLPRGGDRPGVSLKTPGGKGGGSRSRAGPEGQVACLPGNANHGAGGLRTDTREVRNQTTSHLKCHAKGLQRPPAGVKGGHCAELCPEGALLPRWTEWV